MIHTLKWPLILTLVVMAVRILLEEMGAPGALTNIFGVVWLSLLIPLYFAVRLGVREEAYPYKTLLKLIVLYAVCIRLMVGVSYSLAYAFSWSASRFRVQGGGEGGEGVTALQGLLLNPASNFPFGLVMAIVPGLTVVVAILIFRWCSLTRIPASN